MEIKNAYNLEEFQNIDENKDAGDYVEQGVYRGNSENIPPIRKQEPICLKYNSKYVY